MPIGAIPQPVKDAFLSAEDKTFYSHPGIDFVGLGHAMWTNVIHLGSDRRPVGASTITQQVAKNFLLTNEVSIDRKIKEAILALRIEQAFSKDRILELYLNEIYLGGGSYGVAAASLNYFNKSLDELTIAEAAYLGGAAEGAQHLQHAAQSRRRARAARLGGLAHAGGRAHHRRAGRRGEGRALAPRSRTEAQIASADYFAEEVRREIAARFGDRALYEGGLIDPHLARSAPAGDRRTDLRNGLSEYDRRHGWRGPLGHVEPAEDWAGQIAAIPAPKGLHNWNFAMVLALDGKGAEIGVAGGGEGPHPLRRDGVGQAHAAGTEHRARPQIAQGRAAGRRPDRGRGDRRSGRTKRPLPAHSSSRCARFPMSAAPSSPWTRIPAACWPWPAAGATMQASSTAPPRRCASRARPSSRSST